MGVRGSEKVCTSSPSWESRRWRAQELKTRTICWIMFRRITQVTIHQSADDNQLPNGGLSLADASLVLTEPIKSRMGGCVQTTFWEVRSEPSVLDYFRMPVAKEKPRLRRT